MPQFEVLFVIQKEQYYKVCVTASSMAKAHAKVKAGQTDTPVHIKSIESMQVQTTKEIKE